MPPAAAAAAGRGWSFGPVRRCPHPQGQLRLRRPSAAAPRPPAVPRRPRRARCAPRRALSLRAAPRLAGRSWARPAAAAPAGWPACGAAAGAAAAAGRAAARAVRGWRKGRLAAARPTGAARRRRVGWWLPRRPQTARFGRPHVRVAARAALRAAGRAPSPPSRRPPTHPPRAPSRCAPCGCQGRDRGPSADSGAPAEEACSCLPAQTAHAGRTRGAVAARSPRPPPRPPRGPPPRTRTSPPRRTLRCSPTPTRAPAPDPLATRPGCPQERCEGRSISL
jgi:hypothetical protein